MNTNKLEITRELLIVWRSYTGEEVLVPVSNEELGFYDGLLEFFEQNFDSNMSKWEEFVSYVAASKYLMGAVTSFKASLAWITQPQVFVKVTQGCCHSQKENMRYKKQLMMRA